MATELVKHLPDLFSFSFIIPALWAACRYRFPSVGTGTNASSRQLGKAAFSLPCFRSIGGNLPFNSITETRGRLPVSIKLANARDRNVRAGLRFGKARRLSALKLECSASDANDDRAARTVRRVLRAGSAGRRCI